MQPSISPPGASRDDAFSVGVPKQNALALQAAGSARGRAIGALVFTLFGAAWFTQALVGMQWWNPWTMGLLLASTLLLVGSAVAILRSTAGPARQAQSLPGHQQKSRLFGFINVLQSVAIVGAINLLPYWHRTDLIVVTVVLIVGVHLFPLARLFRYVPHYLTGGLLVGWAGLCLALFSGPTRDVLGCAGAGLVLWSSAAFTLFSANQQARRVVASLGLR